MSRRWRGAAVVDAKIGYLEIAYHRWAASWKRTISILPWLWPITKVPHSSGENLAHIAVINALICRKVQLRVLCNVALCCTSLLITSSIRVRSQPPLGSSGQIASRPSNTGAKRAWAGCPCGFRAYRLRPKNTPMAPAGAAGQERHQRVS